MSVNACAALVERADPDRFRATMAAPLAARRVLFPLYALNVEVSRAPWVTQEPMIAEMRLQWWRDALEEIAEKRQPRRHEVVDALVDILDVSGARLLDGFVAARRWDIYKDAFADQDHFNSYIDATSGHLMWTAARLLGRAYEHTVRDYAYAVGVANMLVAAPALDDRGRKPLVDGTHLGIRTLSDTALTRMRNAQRAHRKVSQSSAAAMLAGFRTAPRLRRAAAMPGAVAANDLDQSEAGARLRLLKLSLLGWWR